MAVTGGEIVTVYKSDLRELERGAQRAEHTVKDSARRMNATLGGIGKGIQVGGSLASGGLLGGLAGALKLLPGLGTLATAITAVTGAIKDGISFGFDYNRTMEESRITFERLLGGADKADKKLREIQAFAETSQFELPGILRTIKYLEAVGMGGERAIPIMRTLGDAVAGLGGGEDVLDGIARALGQIQSKGRLSAEEMEQLSERGVQGWRYLSEALASVDKNFAKLGSEQRIGRLRELTEKGLIKGSGAVRAILQGLEKDYAGLGARFAKETASGIEANVMDVAARLAGTASGPAFEAYKRALTGVLRGLNSELAQTAAEGIAGLQTAPLETVNKAIGGLAKMGPTVSAPGFDKAVLDTIGAGDRLYKTGATSVQGFIDGAKSLVPQVIDTGKGIGSAVEEGIRDSLKMRSPSQVMFDLGLGAGNSFKDGFLSGVGTQDESLRAKLQQLLNDPRIKAMLDAIAWAEGADYDTLVGGGKFKDFSSKPKYYNRKLDSTAAGRYQFLNKTWRGAARKLGLSDFGPQSQDLAAVLKMMERGMIGPLLSGDLRGAVRRGAPEWASFPTETGRSFYRGQPARPLAGIEQAYNRSLGGGGPVPVTVVNAPWRGDMGAWKGDQPSYLTRDGRDITGGAVGAWEAERVAGNWRHQGAPTGGAGRLGDMLAQMTSRARGDMEPLTATVNQLGTTIIPRAIDETVEWGAALTSAAEGGAAGIEKTALTLEDLMTAARDSKPVWESMGDSFESIFVSAFSSTEGGFKGMLSRMLLGFIDMLNQMFLQAIAKDIGSAIFGGASGGSGGFTGALLRGLLSGLGGAVAGSIPGAFSGGGINLGGTFGPPGYLPGRQWGGPVSAGQMYETHGLNKREFFMPNTSGQIVTGQAKTEHHYHMHFKTQSPNSYYPRRSEREMAEGIAGFLQAKLK